MHSPDNLTIFLKYISHPEEFDPRYLKQNKLIKKAKTKGLYENFGQKEVRKLEDKFMTISAEGSKSKVKYFYSDPSVIVAPTKEVNMPEADVTFTLTESNLKELLKMAAILKTPDLALVGTNGGNISLTVCDKKNDTSNKFSLDVAEGATADFTFYFKVENMKMFPGDYDVSVSSKSISHFQNKKMPIQYWIALEPDSSFTK